MKQRNTLCAVVLVLYFGALHLEGARMHCENNTECPEDYCCLAVREDLICTRLRRLGQFCQPNGGHRTTDNPEGHQTHTFEGICPCSPGLVCVMGSNATSSSEESESSSSSASSSEERGVCQTPGPEIAEEPEE